MAIFGFKHCFLGYKTIIIQFAVKLYWNQNSWSNSQNSVHFWVYSTSFLGFKLAIIPYIVKLYLMMQLFSGFKLKNFKKLLILYFNSYLWSSLMGSHIFHIYSLRTVQMEILKMLGQSWCYLIPFPNLVLGTYSITKWRLKRRDT